MNRDEENQKKKKKKEEDWLEQQIIAILQKCMEEAMEQVFDDFMKYFK